MTGNTNNTNGKFVIGIEFIPKAVGDCIPNQSMMEISKRLIGYVRDGVVDDIIRSETEPQDKTKLWYVPSTRKLYGYNTETSTWEETNVDNSGVCIAPDSDPALEKDASGCLRLNLESSSGSSDVLTGPITADSAGSANKTVLHTTWEDANASVEVMPKADIGAAARWWVSDQTPSSVTINFAGLVPLSSTEFTIVSRKT